MTSPSKKVRRSSQKPPVPSADDKPIMGLKTCKNFIVSNAAQAIISEPKGLKEPEELFIEKDTYGKVPEYLTKVKCAIQREREIVENHVKGQVAKEGGGESVEIEYEIMDEEERQGLINSLKGKWDEVNSTYQKLCHRNSLLSIGDMRRKEAQEAELQQLETDIGKLSKPGPLYVKKG